MESLLHLVRSLEWHDLLQSKPLVVGLGAFSHVLFATSRPDYKMYRVIPTGLAFFAGLTFFVFAKDEHITTIRQAFALTWSAAAVYVGAIFGSIILYRAFFHTLRKFPGPFLARITQWDTVSRVVRSNLHYHLEGEKMHKKYGDYVRTGPRTLSVIDSEAIPVIHGLQSKCSKGMWYGVLSHIEGYSVHTTRNKQEHKDRRKIWERAFSPKSLKDYEPRLERHTAKLLEQFGSRNKNPICLPDWMNFFAFDVMGDIGFSRSFEMLEKGEETELIKGLHKSMKPLGIFHHVMWFLNLMTYIPGGAKDLVDFMAWTSKVLRERVQITPKEPDIFSWLIEPESNEIPLGLNADSRLVIIAGSDTTTAALSWLFFELCKQPALQKKIQKDVDKVAGDREFLDCEAVADLSYVDACVNEALRLHPPVPSGVQRETPPEGIMIGDKYIPGNTLIWMPHHTIQRDERNFTDAETYIPERWTDRPELIKDKRAFMPFTIGTYNCIGQKLAMTEMRLVTANILRNYDIAFAPGEDGKAFERDTQDTFTVTLGGYNVKLTPRLDGKA